VSGPRISVRDGGHWRTLVPGQEAPGALPAAPAAAPSPPKEPDRWGTEVPSPFAPTWRMVGRAFVAGLLIGGILVGAVCALPGRAASTEVEQTP